MFEFSNKLSCCKDWSDPSKVAKAFAIGKLESEAASNLLERVTSRVTDALTQAIRRRGMKPFLTHEALAKGLFNRGYASGLDGWQEETTNLGDNVLVLCLQIKLILNASA